MICSTSISSPSRHLILILIPILHPSSSLELPSRSYLRILLAPLLEEITASKAKKSTHHLATRHALSRLGRPPLPKEQRRSLQGIPHHALRRAGFRRWELPRRRWQFWFVHLLTSRCMQRTDLSSTQQAPRPCSRASRPPSPRARRSPFPSTLGRRRRMLRLWLRRG